MKFGKEFKTHLEETLPEWRDKFLCYKPLKKLLKHLPSTTTIPDSLLLDPNFYNNNNINDIRFEHRLPVNGDADHAAERRPSMELQDWFIRVLNEELDKFNDFYVDKEEEFVIRLQVILSLSLSLFYINLFS